MTTRVREKTRPRRVTIRDFEPKDYPRMVEISNLVYPTHRSTVKEARFDDEHFDKKYFLHRWVAEDPEGAGVVAVADLSHMPWNFHPHKFWMDVEVHPEWHRRGIGQAMYETVNAELRAKEAVVVRSSTQEDKPESVRWLEKRGFAEKLRNWESHLDLASLDEAKFAEKAVVPPGIEIITLKDARREDPGCLRAIFDMANAIGPDIPGPDAYTATAHERFGSHAAAPRTPEDRDLLAKGEE